MYVCARARKKDEKDIQKDVQLSDSPPPQHVRITFAISKVPMSSHTQDQLNKNLWGWNSGITV